VVIPLLLGTRHFIFFCAIRMRVKTLETDGAKIGSASVARPKPLEFEREDDEHPSSFCPVCSARLESQKCKLRCPTCGYYMSCSDYY